MPSIFFHIYFLYVGWIIISFEIYIWFSYDRFIFNRQIEYSYFNYKYFIHFFTEPGYIFSLQRRKRISQITIKNTLFGLQMTGEQKSLHCHSLRFCSFLETNIHNAKIHLHSILLKIFLKKWWIQRLKMTKIITRVSPTDFHLWFHHLKGI